MDILISSNLERLLFELCDREHQQIEKWMGNLKESGKYVLDDQSLIKLQANLWEDLPARRNMKAIRETYHDYNYVMDLIRQLEMGLR